MAKAKYDVIVVGLSCVGISTAYYASKQGKKVLGIEQYSDCGALGTGSHGDSRCYRWGGQDDRY